MTFPVYIIKLSSRDQHFHFPSPAAASCTNGTARGEFFRVAPASASCRRCVLVISHRQHAASLPSGLCAVIVIDDTMESRLPLTIAGVIATDMHHVPRRITITHHQQILHFLMIMLVCLSVSDHGHSGSNSLLPRPLWHSAPDNSPPHALA